MVLLTFPTHEVVGNTPVLNIIVILEHSTITVEVHFIPKIENIMTTK
jgi:hypothetical protein